MYKSSWRRVFTVICVLNVAQAHVQESGSYNRVETIDDTSFVYKFFFDGTDCTHEFMVNGDVVDQATYEQKKRAASEGECATAYERIRDQHLLFERSCHELRVQGAVALIKRVRDDIAMLLRRVHEYELEPFCVYKPETIGSAAFVQRIEQQLLPALTFCDNVQVVSESPDQLKRIAGLLSELYEHMTLFYQDTVRAALAQSADAKKLQKLLELV